MSSCTCSEEIFFGKVLILLTNKIKYVNPQPSDRFQTYWNLNRLHAEVIDGWEGTGSCQKVGGCGSHCPCTHQQGSGEVLDVLADTVQTQQPQSVQEVHA